MAKTLYIGNLALSVTSNILRTLFSEIGAVHHVEVVRDDYTDESKGYGFVEMDFATDASQAIEALDGYLLANRKLLVLEAHPRDQLLRTPRSTIK